MTEPVRPPFFIVGCSRSGTTLLQTLVDAHPHLAIPPESQIYTRFGPIFDTYEPLDERRNRRRFIRDLLDDAYIRRWNIAAGVEDIDDAVATPTRSGVIEALFKVYAQRKGARRWGDKSPEHVRHLATIRRDFPDAKLIHLVRDGRDTADALRRMTWAPVTAVGLAREWRREVLAWRAFCDRYGSDNTLVVKYEALVADPVPVLAEILNFLDEPFIDTTRTYTSTDLSRAMGARTAVHSSLGKQISSAKVGAYRRVFTLREIEVMESIAGDALKAYGYDCDFAQPRAPAIWQRLSASPTDRIVRWYRKLFLLEAYASDLQFRSRRSLRRIQYGLSPRRRRRALSE